MKHVLITNQHGENRGDESALRAMLEGVQRKAGEVRFSVIAQLQDTNIKMEFDQNVELMHMKMPIARFFGLVLYAMLKKAGFELSFLLTSQTEKIIGAYESCDVVVSAPGGPYFGDIYANHEIVHWFYIWLGSLYKKPLFLYAPSAGPFNKILLNPVRKHFYKKFKVICLREEISKGYLEGLLGQDREIHITADSAIQQVVEPMKREFYFQGEKKNRDKFLVAVSAIEYKFPGEEDPVKKQEEYSQVIQKCLKYLSEKKKCHFLFIPQLYGKVHTDVPYLKHLASALPGNVSWELVDQSFDSNKQRAIFGMSDLCIASRYHPQIFAGSSCVPGVCVYYEHKALGFMRFMGLERFAFDIRDIEADEVIAQLDYLLEHREAVQKQMSECIGEIIKKSEMTTDLLVQLMRENNQPGLK